MGLIGRMGGRSIGAVGKLSDRSKMRWLALGPSLVMDRSRTGRSLIATRILNSSSVVMPSLAVSVSHPVVHCLDGHAQTFCEMPSGGYYLELDLDTVYDVRKEFLSLAYPQGAEVELVSVQFANDAVNGPWAIPTGAVSAVYRGLRESLWELPWRGSIVEDGSSSLVTSVDGLRLVLGSSTWSPANARTGWTAYFATGPNAGFERQVVLSESAALNLDEPFPFSPVGQSVSLRQIGQNYLGSRYVRVKLRLRGSAGKNALWLNHLGLHSFLFEFTGDRESEFLENPSNPAGVSGQFSSGQIHTDLLNGGIDIEQRFGPRDTLDIRWEYMYDGHVEVLKELALGGEFCLVDHHGHLRQGVILPEGGLGWDDLARAAGRGEERAVRMTFREI